MRGLKGYGFFVVMAVIILMAALSGDFFSGMNRNNYSYTQFKKEIEDHQIAAVVVEQNAHRRSDGEDERRCPEIIFYTGCQYGY